MEGPPADNHGQGGRVGKLIPKGLNVKRRWKKQPSKESFGSTASSEEHPRGRSPNSRQPPLNDELSSMSQHSEMIEMIERDEETGLTAEEFEPESSIRPTVPSTHPSQIGHLTTSSPIVQAEHAPEIQVPDGPADDESLSSLFKSATYSVSVTSSGDPSRRLSVSKTDQLPNRSKSPAGRIKDVFKSKRNSSATPSLAGSQKSEQSDKLDKTGDPHPSEPQRAPPEAPLPPNSAVNEPQIPSTPERRRYKGQAAIDISIPPRTPPSSTYAAPVIVNTPPTPTDHNRPASQDSPRKQSRPVTPDITSNPNVTISPSGNMISHRRMRSGSGTSIGPSKLSNITLAPLSPTPENTGPQTPGGGFFSSMISAAQNAATTLSNTVTNTNIGLGPNRPKTAIPKETQEGDGHTTEVESTTAQGETSMGEPAVKTMGMGDLSLSQLGIQEGGSATPTPVASRFPDSGADSRLRSESAPMDASAAKNGGLSEDQSLNRPRSLYESAALSDRSPTGSIYEEKSGGIQRTNSIRSAIGRRRKRGSTGGTANTNGTGTTIGAAIAAANASVAHPNAAGSAPKLTGFAVASKKRNRDFHALFKSVPDDDYLIEDYSCALQREILAHGRLYVSEGHLCFSSNIFGWVTTLVMSFDEIVSVEKRSTALLFKNGLMISTLHARHVFASFTSRDSTYDLIVNIWKLNHPSLRSFLNGVTLDETGGDRTEKVDDLEPPADNSGSGSEVMDDDEESDDGEDVYDEDEDGDVLETNQHTDFISTDIEGEKVGTRKVSNNVSANGMAEKPKDGASAPAEKDFPGPAAHPPTDCGDASTHFERMLGDDIIPAPLGKVYSLTFGPASPNFMGKWLTNEQKCTDLQMEDKAGLTADNKTRAYSYIKPLTAAIGPKQTKCLVNETLEHIDLEKSVNVLVAVQNPDVPSGNLFSVKTKYCLHWAENNSTRIQVNCTIEWTGKSWLKGPIEKGANDGQIQHCKDLFASLKAAVSSRPRSGTNPNGTAGKGKKKKGKGKLDQASKDNLSGMVTSGPSKTDDWGLLEPLHGILGPVVDIIKPVLTGNVVYGLLVGLLVASWFGFGFSPRQTAAGYGQNIGFVAHSDRIVAYEEIWRREESDLWDWLEERVGLHRINEGAMPIPKRAAEPRSFEEKLREEKMNEREVEEAIRITEEKLQLLKGVHHRRKAETTGGSSVYGRPISTISETER